MAVGNFGLGVWFWVGVWVGVWANRPKLHASAANVIFSLITVAPQGQWSINQLISIVT